MEEDGGVFEGVGGVEVLVGEVELKEGADEGVQFRRKLG